MKKNDKTTKKLDKELKKNHSGLVKNGSSIRNISIKSVKLLISLHFSFCPKFILILSEICQNLVRELLSELNIILKFENFRS